MTAHRLAAAAASLAGVRFRLHGREASTGVDCLGLLEAAMMEAGRPIRLPNGYPLRHAAMDAWLPDAAAMGFEAAALPFLPGDVILLQPSAGQVHLAIAGLAGTWIHAHAGLRRVVISPARPDGTLLHHWRLRPAS